MACLKAEEDQEEDEGAGTQNGGEGTEGAMESLGHALSVGPTHMFFLWWWDTFGQLCATFCH
jgi:hypothetical protein